MIITYVTNILASVPGYFANMINLFGANLQFDAEAEYRLAKLGKSIVEAYRVTLDASLRLKASYLASIENRKSRHAYFTQVLVHLTDAKDAWINVAKDFSDTRKWLDGKLREDYSEAFVEAATVGDLHATLVEQGISKSYMAFAFEEIRAICKNSASPSESILACLDHLSEKAKKCAEIINELILYLEEQYEQEDFSLYSYVFASLAVKGEKPQLYQLDEIYFAVQNEFSITYESVEQIARHAHTLVPGTHGQDPSFFDFKFTD